MPRNLPTRALREHPNLDQLRRQAKELLAAFREGEEGAIAEVAAHYRGAGAATFALHDAQLVLARSYGFESWPKLKAHVDGVTVRRLADAVRAGDAEGVRAMLGARPELVNMPMAWNDEHTALHHAVLGRMPEMVRILMQHGADARAGISPHNDATAALTIASDRGYDEIVAIIREEEERRREGGRPISDEAHEELSEAMRLGDEDRAIEILGRHPGLAGLPDRREGWTPLHEASALLLPGVIAWLLDHGADVGRRAKDGSAPPDVVGRWSGDAERAGRSAAVASLLRKRGAQLTARSAVIAADEAALRALHAEGALSAPLDDRGGLLGLAVGNGRPEILGLLLDFGLDPDARARVEGVEDVSFTWGMPLWDCARHGKHEMARMLLERGADPNGQVYASGTPLSEAYGRRDEEMIALLERFGGRSNAAMAGMYRRADLARRLLAEGEEGAASLPDDGFGSGPVAEQLARGAARGGDPEILRMALERVDIPAGDPRWAGLLVAPLEMWNHGPWPWAHHEWDRGDYLACFRMILERCGNPDARLRFGATVLHEVAASLPHVRPEERVAFATMLLDAGARTDLRDDLLASTPLGWACRWGRAELVRLLLERGADPVEAGGEPWATPRAWARRMGRDEVLAPLPGDEG